MDMSHSASAPRRRSPDGNGAFDERPEDRVAKLEAAIAAIQSTLDIQFKRIAAMQAELDHLTARRRDG